MVDDLALGRQMRILRLRRGLRQEDVRIRTGASRDRIREIENGRLDDLRLGDLRRIGAAVGVRLRVSLIVATGDLSHLADGAHAAMVGSVASMLRSQGWDVAVEVEYSGGSVDVLGWHAATRTLLVVEVKSRLTDVQATLRQLGRYERLAPALARRLGWDVAVIGRLLVLPQTRAQRQVVATAAEVLSAALPARNPAVRRWLRAPTGRLDGLLTIPVGSAVEQRMRLRAPKRLTTTGPNRPDRRR